MVKAAGVPKGSFYFYFDSKETFGLGLVDADARVIGESARMHLLDESRGTVERIRGFFGAFGGVASLWTLDALADFRMRVDYTLDPPGSGGVALLVSWFPTLSQMTTSQFEESSTSGTWSPSRSTTSGEDFVETC